MEVPTLVWIVVAVSAVIILGMVIAIICLAVVPYKSIVYFDEYTAECYTMFMDPNSFVHPNSSGHYGFDSPPRIDFSKEYYFNAYKWRTETYADGQVDSYEFSTGDDDLSTLCRNLGNHWNCFVKTTGPHSFLIPGKAKATLVKSEMDVSNLEFLLPGIIPLRRKVTKCDVYMYFDDYMTVTAYMESGTNYPYVLDIAYAQSLFQGVARVYKVYDVFKPGKPSDDSILKPVPGVTIYDFRNGKGDAGKGKSNVYTEASRWESLRNKLTWSDRVRKADSDKHMQAIRFNEEIRSFLHLPLKGLSGKGMVRSREYSMRDAPEIPESFDARNAWPSCSSVIGIITDQSTCGSCWAMSSAGVLSDRLCISQGIQRQLSPQYLMYCSQRNKGCFGGQTLSCWEDFMKYGVTSEECVPFAATNGNCPVSCSNGTLITEEMKVRPSGYVVPWGKTKEERVKAIQREIMTNGPVQGSLWTFSDFQDYLMWNTGIYHRSEDAYWAGGHAVRIIGWGTESGEDYWLCANSWGTSNAGKGFFRIRRGNNECNLEETVAAGVLS